MLLEGEFPQPASGIERHVLAAMQFQLAVEPVRKVMGPKERRRVHPCSLPAGTNEQDAHVEGRAQGLAPFSPSGRCFCPLEISRVRSAWEDWTEPVEGRGRSRSSCDHLIVRDTAAVVGRSNVVKQV
jgi:hypothetical protein